MWDFAVRQQNFSEVAAIEKEPEGFLVEDLEGCTFADFRHGGTMDLGGAGVDGEESTRDKSAESR